MARPRRGIIPVRNRHTGQIGEVAEASWGLFAADYERLDQPAAEPDAPAAQPAAPSTPAKSRTPRAAAEQE